MPVSVKSTASAAVKSACATANTTTCGDGGTVRITVCGDFSLAWILVIKRLRLAGNRPIVSARQCAEKRSQIPHSRIEQTSGARGYKFFAQRGARKPARCEREA